MSAEEPTTYLNTRDRARIRRVFAGMRFAGGMPICSMDSTKISIDELMEALDELTGRLVRAAETIEAGRRREERHERMFTALGDLLNEAARAARLQVDND